MACKAHPYMSWFLPASAASLQVPAPFGPKLLGFRTHARQLISSEPVLYGFSSALCYSVPCPCPPRTLFLPVYPANPQSVLRVSMNSV